jgi:preprotein translocase subunit SecB
MSDEKPAQKLEIQRVYLKDVSLETPNSPQIFSERQWQPEINLQINSTSAIVSDELREVVLKLTVTAKLGDKTAYLVEVQQAGVFMLFGFPDEQLGPVLGAFCPNILFPFAREAIASLVSKGGFPPLLLNPVNFDALYLQHAQAQKQQAAEKVGH